MSITGPLHRRARALTVIALVVAMATTYTVARASRRPAVPYSDRCTAGAPDADRDRLPDCWERKNGLDPSRADAGTDLDRDGLRAIEEFVLDMRGDGRPLFPYRASVRDSNGNGTADGDEDLDGDGLSNRSELENGTDPFDPADPPTAGSRPKPSPSPSPTKPPHGPPPSPTTPPTPSPTPSVPPSPSPSLPPSPGPTPGPSSCATPPSSIASDGSHDVRAELQAFIDGVPDGSCITLPSGARYRVDDTLYLRERHDLTINAAGATIFTDTLDPINPDGKGGGSSDRRQLQIQGGSNITLDGLTIDGPNPTGAYLQEREPEAGLAVQGTQVALLANLTIREVYGDFAVITDYNPSPGNPATTIPARGVVLTGGHFEVAGRQGVAMTGNSENTTIDGNSFRDMSRSGIDIELLPGRTVSDARITNNVFQEFGLNWIAMGGRSSVNGAYFGHNRIVGDTMRLKIGPPAGVYGVVHQHLTFDGNTSDVLAQGDTALFSFRYVNHVLIVGNVQHFAPNTAGVIVSADGGCDYTVENNDFAGMTTMFATPRPPACSA